MADLSSVTLWYVDFKVLFETPSWLGSISYLVGLLIYDSDWYCR